MKTYSNGQRPTKMYGGGLASPRKPMQMGGLVQQNRKMTVGSAGMQNPMGTMTEKKRFSMGMKKGGKVETKVADASEKMEWNKYGLAAKKVGTKYESYLNGKLTGTFNSIKELEKHQLGLISGTG